MSGAGPDRSSGGGDAAGTAAAAAAADVPSSSAPLRPESGVSSSGSAPSPSPPTTPAGRSPGGGGGCGFSCSGGGAVDAEVVDGGGVTPYVKMEEEDGDGGGGGGGGGGGNGEGGGGRDDDDDGGDGRNQSHVVTFESEVFERAAAGDDDASGGKNSYATSIASTVLTADEISDPRGFFIVCLVVLVGDMSRGVFFPIMWPLVQLVGGDTVQLGYAVAAFSFGRILSSPLFGSWSVTHGYRNTLIISVSILVAGTLLWAQVGNVGTPSFLILAQTVLGLGSGTLGVTRAFVADVTPNHNRTTYMAWLTAVQYGGFTMTPLFGAIFAFWYRHDEREIHAGLFVLDEYTSPAYFMTIVCSITIALLCTAFEDRECSQGDGTKKKSKRALAKDGVANARVCCSLLTTYDACILGCMLLNIATKGSIASFETLGVAIAEGYFNMRAARAGFIVAACGTLGVVSLFSMGHLAKVMTDVQMIVGGMLIMIVGVLTFTGLEEGGEKNPSWRYMVTIFLVYSIGYPIGHTALIGLFSKIVGRRPQGQLLGWFASAGSLARITFPVMSGYVSAWLDMSSVFVVLTVVLAIATVFTIAANDTLRTLSS